VRPRVRAAGPAQPGRFLHACGGSRARPRAEPDLAWRARGGAPAPADPARAPPPLSRLHRGRARWTPVVSPDRGRRHVSLGGWVAVAIVVVGAPALTGLVVRTKAALAGRRGPPITQLYHDLWKLLRKDAIFSPITTWVFRAGPIVGLTTLLFATLLLPLDGRQALVRFPGDLLAFAGLLALGRFALVLAALDTGSSFEGMGASREVTVASFAEPALFLCFTALV